MKVVAGILCYAGIAFLLNAGNADAATLYVDGNTTGSVESGTIKEPFRKIQAALNAAANRDTIRVAPGSYAENLTISKTGITLLGANPATTTIQAAGTVVSINASEVIVGGFTVTGGSSYGIRVAANIQSSIIRNNIITSNRAGVMVEGGAKAAITNNAIVKNLNGIEMDGEGGIFNNIMDNNDFNAYGNCGGFVSYNVLIPQDKIGGYPANTCTMPHFGNTNSDPLLSPDNSYTLRAASPAINAGRPLAADNDPDGSRNDIGVYGGPGAADFWPGTPGGPVVTELVVSPPSVAQGGKITIKATAVTR